MTNLSFNYEHVCEESYHSNDLWGDWHEVWTYTPPTRAWVASEASYGDFPYVENPDDPLTDGDKLYAIYVVWSTGDSFGHSTRGNTEILCVNKNQDMADRNLEKIKNAKTMAVLELDNGTTMNCYCGSWEGYFESLDYLDIAEVIFSSDSED